MPTLHHDHALTTDFFMPTIQAFAIGPREKFNGEVFELRPNFPYTFDPRTCTKFGTRSKALDVIKDFELQKPSGTSEMQARLQGLEQIYKRLSRVRRTGSQEVFQATDYQTGIASISVRMVPITLSAQEKTSAVTYLTLRYLCGDKKTAAMKLAETAIGRAFNVDFALDIYPENAAKSFKSHAYGYLNVTREHDAVIKFLEAVLEVGGKRRTERSLDINDTRVQDFIKTSIYRQADFKELLGMLNPRYDSFWKASLRPEITPFWCSVVYSQGSELVSQQLPMRKMRDLSVRVQRLTKRYYQAVSCERAEYPGTISKLETKGLNP